MRVIVTTMRLYESFVETMEKCLRSVARRDDAAQIVTMVQEARQALKLVQDKLVAGVTLQEANRLLGALGQHIDATRLAIRRMTGIKSWATWRW